MEYMGRTAEWQSGPVVFGEKTSVEELYGWYNKNIQINVKNGYSYDIIDKTMVK